MNTNNNNKLRAIISNTEELATAMQCLSKTITGRRDGYFFRHKTASLGTLVRHARRVGLEVRLYSPQTDKIFYLDGLASIHAAMQHIVSELKGSFITHHHYMTWLRQNNIHPDAATSWNGGESTPKLDKFFRITVEELGYQVKLIPAGN